MNSVVLGLVLMQVALPLVLIIGNALLPSASRPGFLARFVAILALCGFLALVGVWLFPPWWTAYALAVLHLVLSAWGWLRLEKAGPRGSRLWRGIEAVAGLAGIGAVAVMTAPALQGRGHPPDSVDLAMPLGQGSYLVTSGGSTTAINGHLLAREIDTDLARSLRGQNRAVDIIGLDGLGFTARGISPADPEQHVIYGADVLAPCSGAVAHATTGVPDMPVPIMDRDNMTGNSLLLACDGGVFVFLGHLAPGSLSVDIGDEVVTGQILARVGNTGNTAAPHLHIHVQDSMPPEAPISGEAQFFTIEGRFLVRNSRFVVTE